MEKEDSNVIDLAIEMEIQSEHVSKCGDLESKYNSLHHRGNEGLKIQTGIDYLPGLTLEKISHSGNSAKSSSSSDDETNKSSSSCEQTLDVAFYRQFCADIQPNDKIDIRMIIEFV